MYARTWHARHLQTLKRNTTIHTLDLSSNSLDPSDLPQLLELFEHNNHLARVNLTDNVFAIEDFIEMFELIMYARAIPAAGSAARGSRTTLIRRALLAG
jgi:hypothetical protein